MKQRGALFGLDARIALAIFSMIAIVAGVTMVLNVDKSRGQSLASELGDVARAVEQLHNDLETDVFYALDVPSEKNAFTALYDGTVITDNNHLRGKWLGPYVRFSTNLHPRFGDMLLQARSETFGTACVQGAPCYIWVVYSFVKPSIAHEVDRLVDGEDKKSESTGVVQWFEDNAHGKEAVVLAYRATRTLRYSGE